MKYYISSGTRRKKNVFLMILITITLIGLIATLVLIGGFFYVDKEVVENQTQIELIEKNTDQLQNEINLSKENLELYEKRLETLTEETVRFEPIIIPDSMRNQ